MHRRLILSLIGLAPLTLFSSKIPTIDSTIVDNLVKRWKKSKAYTLAVFEAMPEDTIEYSPSTEQMSFAQHFMHLGLINNFYMGILTDSKTYKDFDALINTMCEQAFASGSPNNNPRIPTLEEMVKLYTLLWNDNTVAESSLS